MNIQEILHLMDTEILPFGHLGAENIEFEVGRSNFKKFEKWLFCSYFDWWLCLQIEISSALSCTVQNSNQISLPCCQPFGSSRKLSSLLYFHHNPDIFKRTCYESFLFTSFDTLQLFVDRTLSETFFMSAKVYKMFKVYKKSY